MVFRSRDIALLAAILAAGLVSGAGGISAEESGKPDKPVLRVAVVDFSRVFNEYKKTKVLKDKQEEKFGERRAALEKRGQKLVERRDALRIDTRPKDDPGFAADLQGFSYDAVLFENAMKALDKEQSEFNYKHMKQIVAEIDEAVRRFAVSRDYDLVLKAKIDSEEPRSAVQLTQQIALNPVLYFNPSVDISDSIITILNTAYDRGIQLVPGEAAG